MDLNDLRKSLELAKIWNQVLTNNNLIETNKLNYIDKIDYKDYIDLDNYAFRMNLLIESNTIETLETNKSNRNEKLDNLILKCNNFILKNSSLNSYLATKEKQIQEKKNFLNDKSSNLSNNKLKENQIEIILDDSLKQENKKDKVNEKLEEEEEEEEKEKEENKEQDKQIQIQIEIKIEEKIEEKIEQKFQESTECFKKELSNLTDSNVDQHLSRSIAQMLTLIKKSLSEKDEKRTKEIIVDVCSKFDLESVKLFNLNLLNIENFDGEMKIENEESKDENLPKHRHFVNRIVNVVSLKENELSLILNLLIELNTNSTVLSYNLSYTFLKQLLCEYIMFNLAEIQSNEQTSKILSRKIFSLCSCLINQFPQQFILSCLLVWLIEIIINTNMSNNKIFVEFIIKLIKDSFNESQSMILLECLLNTENVTSLKWSESFYSVLTCLNEKLPNINLECFNRILNKMKTDSIDLAKSIVFSKFLQSLLNKYKRYFTLNNNNFNNGNNNDNNNKTNRNEENDSIQFDLNNKFQHSFQSQSLSQHNLNTNTINTTNTNPNPNSSNNIDLRLVNLIESIVECNQTMMKKSLLNFVKNLI